MVIFGPPIYISKGFTFILQGCIATPLDFKYQLEVRFGPAGAYKACWKSWKSTEAIMITKNYVDTIKQAHTLICPIKCLLIFFRQSLMVLRGGSLFVRMHFLEGWNYLSKSIQVLKRYQHRIRIKWFYVKSFLLDFICRWLDLIYLLNLNFKDWHLLGGR